MLKHSIRAPGCRLPLETIISPIFSIIIIRVAAVRVHIHKKIQQINAEYTSKVTSLQALLRKAFRSPGALALGDFGIFCLILYCASRKKKIKRKFLT